MDISFYLVWLICSAHLIFCLPILYEDRKVFVFVGADLKMKCDGPPTAQAVYIEWRMINGVNDTLIFVCPSRRYGSCQDIDDQILNAQNSSTSTLTLENVSPEDAREYVCTIRLIMGRKQCRFIVTIKEPPVGLTFIHENEGTAINSSFFKVRADVNTTIGCRANSSVYLQWYPNCSDLSYHACRESDPQNGSRTLSFTSRASQNGTILTCRTENKDEASGNVNISITLQVEVCIQHLQVDSFESTVSGQSALSCQTNTSNFNLTSSSLFFNTSYQDGRGNENTNASWGNAGALHLSSIKLDSNVSSMSCCVSKTSLCPGVCSEEYFKVLNGSIYLASTDHPEIITVANTDGFPETVPFAMYAVGATVLLIMIVIVFIFVFQRCRKTKKGRVPGKQDNVHGPGTHPKGHDRGALPPIPTITTEPSIHQSPVPSHVAKINRHMAQRSQDLIPLQSLVSPVDDTLQRVQNRTMGARSNAGTRANMEQVSDAEDHDMCSGYMDMRPIAPVQQYITLIGDGASMEDELGSYMSPTLTRKHFPTTTGKTFLGDPTYMNTEEVSYVDTILKRDYETFHSE